MPVAHLHVRRYQYVQYQGSTLVDLCGNTLSHCSDGISKCEILGINTAVVIGDGSPWTGSSPGAKESFLFSLGSAIWVPLESLTYFRRPRLRAAYSSLPRHCLQHYGHSVKIFDPEIGDSSMICLLRGLLPRVNEPIPEAVIVMMSPCVVSRKEIRVGQGHTHTIILKALELFACPTLFVLLDLSGRRKRL